eukprot:1156569-Pelagomonas_calceolata.AAC.1
MVGLLLCALTSPVCLHEVQWVAATRICWGITRCLGQFDILLLFVTLGSNGKGLGQMPSSPQEKMFMGRGACDLKRHLAFIPASMRADIKSLGMRCIVINVLKAASELHALAAAPPEKDQTSDTCGFAHSKCSTFHTQIQYEMGKVKLENHESVGTEKGNPLCLTFWRGLERGAGRTLISN